MRAMGSVLLLLTLSACGGDDSGGGPPTLGDSQSSVDPEPDEQIASEIGACRALCCSNADCGGGNTCTPLSSASGTLGVCTPAVDEATAADPPPGADPPAGCWTENAASCNPLTNEGCSAGDACDFGPGDDSVEPVLGCFGGDNSQGPGQSCDNALGPWCMPGYHCVAD